MSAKKRQETLERFSVPLDDSPGALGAEDEASLPSKRARRSSKKVILDDDDFNMDADDDGDFVAIASATDDDFLDDEDDDGPFANKSQKKHKAKKGKGKGKAAPVPAPPVPHVAETLEWVCPVNMCGRVHWSERVVTGGTSAWQPMKETGAVGVFV